MTIRIAILGCGSIARAAHLPSLTAHPDVRVTALADTDAASLAAAQALVPDAVALHDLNAAVDRADVDAVVVALPPALHASAAIAALGHGKHVYVEKPIAATIDDAEQVLDAWRRTRLVGMMGFNYRYNPLVEDARRRLAAGAVGTPIAIRTVFATAPRTVPAWKSRRDTGGGVLLDLAVHHIDLVRHLLGTEFHDVSARVRSVRTDDDTVLLQAGLTSGATAQILCSLSAVEDDRIEVYGTGGRLTIDRYRSLHVEVTGPAAGGAFGTALRRLAGELTAAPYALRKRTAPMHDPSFTRGIDAFVRAIRDGTTGYPDLADGVRALAVIDEAERSAATESRPATVVATGATPETAAAPRTDDDPAAPALSFVLITPDSFDTIRQTSRCVARQEGHERIELVIVAPASATIDVDPAIAEALAGVQVVRLHSVSPSGPARAAAIRAARAPIVAFGEEHCFPQQGWAKAMLAAYRGGDYAAVGPALRNANPDSIVSWADFLIGYGPWVAPVESGEREYLPGHNSSYTRAALMEYEGRLPELMEAETVLMWDLRRNGKRLRLASDAQAAHTNFGRWSSWTQVMLLNGRAFAHTRSQSWSPAKRAIYAAASPLIPFVRLARTVGHARRLGRGPLFLARIVPTLSVGLALDGIGQMAGYALGAGHAHERLAEFEWHRMQHTARGAAATS